mgnify:FL=1
MSFLTPLYLLGALAIGLPILAHLIRRTPPRRQEFSSVAFLTPAEPKVTRRSRIENWPLLCLRALVIVLLAAAFARPFWRTPAAVVAADEDARWAAVLVDTSASMRRDGLWDEARERLGEVLGEYGPFDHVGVFTFDSSPTLVWNWEAWSRQSPGQRAASVAVALEDVQPGWRETNLGAALIAAAEALENESAQESFAGPLEIVVVSDLQAGSRIDELLGYAWPGQVTVRLAPLGRDLSPDNAGLQPAKASDGAQRVRVTNADDADAQSFVLDWSDLQTEPASAVEVAVPAGQSRIVRAPQTPENVDGAVLMLRGDAHAFDNACYVTVPQQDKFTVAYVGDDDPDDPAEHRFYVEPLFADTEQRDVTVVDWNRETAMSFVAESPIRLVLLTGIPAEEQIGPLRDYVRTGGLLIDVLRSSDAVVGLASLIGMDGIPASEAEVDGFSLLTDIDFDHPALAQFSDPKFSDFTTLHFWRHRRIEAGEIPALRVLARFDDGDVAIGEIPLGEGRVVFFTSGWNRADSELAVWSKFVPLMNGLLETARGLNFQQSQLTVGDEIPWRAIRGTAEGGLRLTRPDGSSVPLSDETESVTAEAPGFYTVSAEGDPAPVARFAVNLPASESETAPLSADQLESVGVTVNRPTPVGAEDQPTEQRLEDSEVEQQQSLWRWTLLAVVILLLMETAWSGWLTRRSVAPGEPARAR